MKIQNRWKTPDHHLNRSNLPLPIAVKVIVQINTIVDCMYGDGNLDLRRAQHLQTTDEATAHIQERLVAYLVVFHQMIGTGIEREEEQQERK